MYLSGMFMVCADFRGKDSKLITYTCRSAMLHYRSTLLQYMYTIIYSPFYLLGSFEEKQHISIELFSEYNEHEVIIRLKQNIYLTRSKNSRIIIIV